MLRMKEELYHENEGNEGEGCNFATEPDDLAISL
jgi:hypothetical protein